MAENKNEDIHSDLVFACVWIVRCHDRELVKMIKANGYEYETAKLTEQTVDFPKGERKCMYCPYLNEYPWHRCTCAITREIIPHEESMIGAECPLKFEELF